MPETIAPPAAAPAAPSAPSTPAPAPSSTPSPAPAATTPTPTTPSDFSTGPTIEDKLTSALTTARESVNKELGDQPAEAAPAETTPAPDAQPAETAPATETEAKPADGQPTEETEEFSVEGNDALAPNQFAEKIKASPEVQKFFDDNPTLKQQVFAALRRDSENREIRTIVPNVEAAKEMQRGANLYLDFDNAFLDAESGDAQGFVQRLAQEAIILGDDGQPKRNGDGSYMLHPALGNILNHIYRTQAEYAIGQYAKSGQMSEGLAGVIGKAADAMASRAKLSGDERTEEAARILKEFASPSSSAPEELPEHLRAQADSLKARESALNEKEQNAARQRQEEAKVAHQTSIDRAEETAAIGFQNQLKPAIAKAGLTPAETEWALSKIGNEIDTYLNENQWFQNQMKAILRLPAGEGREKKHTALIQTYAQQKLGEIAVKVLREATAGAVKRQTDKQTKVDTQAKTSSTEPRGTSITMGQPQGRVSNAQLIAEYKTSHNGQEPTMEWVMGEQLKRARSQPRA